MRRMRILAAAAAVAGVIAVALVGYLLLELSQANADLQDIQESLAQSRADRTAIVELHNTLVTDLTALNSSLAETKADRDRLHDEAHELSEENRTLTHEKSVLTQEYDHLKDTHEQLTATHQQLTTRHLTLEADHADLNDQHSRLQQSVGTIQELESRAGSLRTEIAHLQGQLAPLILRSLSQRDGGFACTGSMNPKITCLDTATWLYNFQPGDIVVGATISFKSNACWPNDPPNNNTAHRVMDIRYSNGIYYYWPKGDANSQADGCWVPHTAVRGYIIEVHKNTRPENAPLRNNVQVAERAYEAARNALPAAENAVRGAENAVESAKNAYYAARDEYNSYLRSSLSICTIQSICANYLRLVEQARERRDRAFAAWDRALDRYSQAVAHYEQVYSRYERARDYYDCWYRNAKDSEYPGHIPYRC